MKNRSIRPHRGIRNSRADRVFYGVNGVLMALTFLLYAWPLWFVLIASFSDPNLVQAGQVLLLPKGFHLGGYKLILEYQDILRGYLNSILYTVVGTALNLVMTICAAYPLPRKVLTVLFVFTMYFSGGLIPLYLQVKNLGLYNSPLAMIVPSAISIYNVLILRSFFMYGVPKSLEEAALLDGANTAQMLWRVILPLSKPILATVALMTFRASWNNYLLPNLMLARDQAATTLVVAVVKLQSSGGAGASQYNLMMAGTMLAMLPMLILFLCMNKMFVEGITQGAVKG